MAVDSAFRGFPLSSLQARTGRAASDSGGVTCGPDFTTCSSLPCSLKLSHSPVAHESLPNANDTSDASAEASAEWTVFSGSHLVVLVCFV